MESIEVYPGEQGHVVIKQETCMEESIILISPLQVNGVIEMLRKGKQEALECEAAQCG